MTCEAICHFHARAIARGRERERGERGRDREKCVFSFTHEQYSICSQTQLDDIAHEQTILCRQLFRSPGGLSANEKEDKFASNDN